MKKELLAQLGLGQKEITVYLALLKQGKTTPAKIALTTKLNRATVYHLCKNLVSKGLVTEDLGGTTLYVVPTPPSDLNSLIKKERDHLKKREGLINEVINELSLVSVEKNYPVPRIQFIEENKLENHLYASAQRWNDSVLKYDKIWWGFQDHSFVQTYLPWIKWLWETAHKITNVKLLSNQSDIEKSLRTKYTRRDIKFLAAELDFTASIWIAGDYLIMVATRQNPHYLVEIHDATLAENMRRLFQNIWGKLGDSSKP